MMFDNRKRISSRSCACAMLVLRWRLRKRVCNGRRDASMCDGSGFERWASEQMLSEVEECHAKLSARWWKGDEKGSVWWFCPAVGL